MTDRAAVIEKVTDAVGDVLIGRMFELITPKLREEVTNDAAHAILGVPEVWGYNVICDQSNNSELNRLNVDVHIWFDEAQSAKFRVTAQPTGISFAQI